MNRRRFICTTLALTVVCPVIAQKPSKRRVAWLSLPGESPRINHARFVRERLAELGFDESRLEWSQIEWPDARTARDMAQSIGQ